MKVIFLLPLMLATACATPYEREVRRMTDAEICAQVRDRGQHGLLSAEEAMYLSEEMDRRGIIGKECL